MLLGPESIDAKPKANIVAPAMTSMPQAPHVNHAPISAIAKPSNAIRAAIVLCIGEAKRGS